jgi:hypothetical protein
MFGRFGGDSGPGSGQQHTGSILSQKRMSFVPPPLTEMETKAKASAHGGVVDREWFSPDPDPTFFLKTEDDVPASKL